MHKLAHNPKGVLYIVICISDWSTDQRKNLRFESPHWDGVNLGTPVEQKPFQVLPLGDVSVLLVWILWTF